MEVTGGTAIISSRWTNGRHTLASKVEPDSFFLCIYSVGAATVGKFISPEYPNRNSPILLCALLVIPSMLYSAVSSNSWGIIT